jgi:hypothetical protein
MAAHGAGKLIPPDDVIKGRLEEQLQDEVRDIVRERILREAGYERQVAEALKAIERPTATELVNGIKKSFAADPAQNWASHVEQVATDLAKIP